MELLIAVIAIVIYFAPGIYADATNRKMASSIMVINLFLGWTFIGWVVALAMAVGSERVVTVK